MLFALRFYDLSLYKTIFHRKWFRFKCVPCRCSGYRGIPVHLLLGPVIGPSSAQGIISDTSHREDPHEEAPREENDDRNR
jgi:hypothetical protein